MKNRRTARTGKFLMALAALATTGLFTPTGPVSAQEKSGRLAPPGAFEGDSGLHEMHGSWKLTCGLHSMQKLCIIGQPLFEGIVRSEGASIEVTPADRNGVQMVLTLPFSTDLTAGVRLVVDQGQHSISLPIQGCSAFGCHAVAVLQDRFLDEMRTGETLRLLTKSGDGRPMELQAGLAEFADAHDRALQLLR